MTHKIKVTCLTPKGKAVQCEKEWRKQFPTFQKPIDKGITSDSEFYWVYEFDKLTDMYIHNKKYLMAAWTIRKFYGFMIRSFTRAVKLANRSEWGTRKVRNWLLKKYNKSKVKDEKTIEKIKTMKDDELKEWIKLEDKEEIEAFLKTDIIVTKYMGED